MVGGCWSSTCPPRSGGRALSCCSPGPSGSTCEVAGAGPPWGCPRSWSEQGWRFHLQEHEMRGVRSYDK